MFTLIVYMELKPRIGVDNIKFGMTQREFLETIGIPDKKWIERDSYDADDDKVYFEYNKLRLVFYLKEEGRLGYLYIQY